MSWVFLPVSFFVKILQRAFRNILGRQMMLPPVPDLIQVFEMESPVSEPVNAKPSGPDGAMEEMELGTRIMVACVLAHCSRCLNLWSLEVLRH